MPTLETPPNPAPTQPPSPEQDRSSGRVKAGRFGELDHSELVHLLDTLDDERAKARFRESVYISLFFWMAVVALLIFAPRIFPRRPEFVMPGLSENKRIANLTIPPDVQHALDHAPRFKAAPKAAGPKSPEPPAQQPPAAPQPVQQQPPPNQAPQPAAPAPPPVVQQSPLQQPRPQQQAALPSAPTPSPSAKPDFGNPNTSARDMIQQATRAPRGGGDGGTIGGNPNGPASQRGMAAGPQILSDTMGVDFNPYLNKIMREIYETWLPLIPEEARPPLNKQGETQIRFIINPDGSIGGMALEDSTHDDAINHACWGSITGVNQFPPLPKQFHGPNLELRIRYFTNREPK
jgi:outer membrane biosynthesis protein TonB